MGNLLSISALLRRLGRDAEHPVVVRRYRSVAVMQHHVEVRNPWSWTATDALEDAVGVVLFANVPLRVSADSAPEVIVAPGELGFLHPSRTHAVTAAEPGPVFSIWVPWDSLADIEQGITAPTARIAATTLTGGLRAFILSLLSQVTDPTPFTDYLVERIVAEMVFGVLVEAAPNGVDNAREARPIDRLRTLMLIRRADPSFGVDEMARELHVSVRQVQRFFATVGSTPAEELRRLRVDLAQELLADEQYHLLSTEEIAFHSGFVSSAALRRAFTALGLEAPHRRRRTV